MFSTILFTFFPFSYLGAAARFPSADKILEHSEEISDKALLSVSKCTSVVESDDKFKHLVGHMASIAAAAEWKNFVRQICKELVETR